LIFNLAFNGKEIRPDVCVGKLFASYLKKKHPELAGHYKMHMHFSNYGSELEAGITTRSC